MASVEKFDPKWSHDKKVDWFLHQVQPNIFADCEATIVDSDKEIAYTKIRLHCNQHSRITVLLIDAPKQRSAI